MTPSSSAVHDDVGQPQPPGGRVLTGKAPTGQRRSELGPGRILSPLKLLDDQLDAAVPSVGIESRLAVDRLVELLNSGRGDLQDPTDVLGGHEMPRRAENMRSEELPPVELGLRVSDCDPRASHAKRPQRMGVLLRLYAAQ